MNNQTHSLLITNECFYISCIRTILFIESLQCVSFFYFHKVNFLHLIQLWHQLRIFLWGFQTRQCFQSWWGALCCSPWLSALPCLDLVRKKGLKKESELLLLALFFLSRSWKAQPSGAKSERLYVSQRENISAWGDILAHQCAAGLFCSLVMCLQFTQSTESVMTIHSSCFLRCFRT